MAQFPQDADSGRIPQDADSGRIPQDADSERTTLLSCLSLLLHHLTAGWPRRGRSLLEIGCGDGRVLDVLWALGFDITCLEHDPSKAEAAREMLGGRCDIQLGAYDDLPYEDDAFDYVVMVKVFGQNPDVDALLHEAVRVATRHVLLIFPNAWSLWAAMRLPWRGRPKMIAYSPWRMLRTLRRVCPGCGFALRSVLPGPPSTWTLRQPWHYGNSKLWPLPFGSFVGIRLDIPPLAPVTGLPLRVATSPLTMSGAAVTSCGGECTKAGPADPSFPETHV